jgi:sugar phosphate isomerase/epimerase
VPSLNGPKNPTLDDVKRSADEYNKMGEKAAQAGIQQGLHNEDFELSKVDGQRTYDVLFRLLDSKLVKFQFQVSTISDGYDAAQYFMKYPGRFISMHVQGWDSNTREIVAVGQGTLDWKKIFTAAKTGGVKNYFVEMDLEKMRASVPYLRKLQASSLITSEYSPDSRNDAGRGHYARAYRGNQVMGGYRSRPNTR